MSEWEGELCASGTTYFWTTTPTCELSRVRQQPIRWSTALLYTVRGQHGHSIIYWYLNVKWMGCRSLLRVVRAVAKTMRTTLSKVVEKSCRGPLPHRL